MIVAIDKFGREVFSIQIQRAPKRKPKVKDPDASDEEEEAEEVKQTDEEEDRMTVGINPVEVSAKWDYIESNSAIDDVSSNGTISNNASPMQSPMNGAYFVEEFRGKAKIETKQLTEKEAK